MTVIPKQKTSPETRRLLREWFINSPEPLTFAQMSQMSEQAIGQYVSAQDITNMSFNDPEGGWSTLRSIKNPDTNEQKLQNLANEMYKIAMGADEDEDDQGKTVKTPNSVKVQAARTFNDISTRLGPRSGRTPQTPASRVSELISEAQSEADERKRQRAN